MTTLFHTTPNSLREDYINETIERKISVFSQKISFKVWSDLVLCLSFLESVLRHYVVEGYYNKNADHSKINIYKNNNPLNSTKKTIKNMSIKDLLLEYNNLNKNTLEDESSQLKIAQEYRNIVVHDCTYLGGDKQVYIRETLRYIIALMHHQGLLRRFFKSQDVQNMCKAYMGYIFEWQYKRYCIDYRDLTYKDKEIYSIL